jgi:glycosyltransferase involved in cell wall biosynthesis
MNSVPLISIITPVWNGLPFLKECVDSVLKQSFQNWEMIISDDGSTDGSRNYINSLTDSRIKVFMQDKNLGIFGNLNFIFATAKAPVCQLLCQDDYFVCSDSLNTIVNYWDQAPVGVGFARFNHSGPSPCRTISLEKEITPKILSADKADLWFFVFGCVPSNLSNVTLRTRIVAELGGFRLDLPYAGDFEFWSRAARKFDMGFEKKRVTFVRGHVGQASNHLNRKGELVSQIERVVNELYLRLLKQYPKEEFMLRLQGTLNYDSLQRDVAIRFWLKGHRNYLKEVDQTNKTSQYAFKQPIAWLIYSLSVGGRVARDVVAKTIIQRLT